MKYRIIGRRWFQRSYGNTYHSAVVQDAEGNTVLSTGVHYGYGEQYLQTALSAMQEQGLIPAPQDGRSYYWGDLEALGIIHEVHDVARQRDL